MRVLTDRVLLSSMAHSYFFMGATKLFRDAVEAHIMCASWMTEQDHGTVLLLPYFALTILCSALQTSSSTYEEKLYIYISVSDAPPRLIRGK